MRAPFISKTLVLAASGLFAASQNGHEAVVRLLLENKAGVKTADKAISRWRYRAVDVGGC